MKLLLTFAVVVLQAGFLIAQNHAPIYSFFTAGHTYGNPITYQYGLHPPFVDFIPTINENLNIELGFLTGDVVPFSTGAYWDSAEVDIANLIMPVYIAAGNHDMGYEFVSRYENYYFSLVQNGDLFIVLTPGLDNWNISGDQLEFLINTLNDNSGSVKNIFIFLHELIWWSPTNKYKEIDINYAPQYPGSTNFDAVVKPILLDYPNPITIFAGDLGATEMVSPFMYDNFENITLIGTGMGGGIRDNIIITKVFTDTVHYQLVAINGDDPDKLGELTDHIITGTHNIVRNDAIYIYPNPCTTHFTVDNSSLSSLTFYLFDIFGRLVKTGIASKNSKTEIGTSELAHGIYYIQLTGTSEHFEQKIVVN